MSNHSCGRGLLLIGVAKRVPRGHAIGIDLWSQEDQGDNRKDANLANARAEGVADRLEIQDGDMRKLPFENAGIDVAVANLSIHNIYNREGRREAINETVRVLKPGGKVALMDFEHVKDVRRRFAYKWHTGCASIGVEFLDLSPS